MPCSASRHRSVRVERRGVASYSAVGSPCSELQLFRCRWGLICSLFISLYRLVFKLTLICQNDNGENVTTQSCIGTYVETKIYKTEHTGSTEKDAEHPVPAPGADRMARRIVLIFLHNLNCLGKAAIRIYICGVCVCARARAWRSE